MPNPSLIAMRVLDGETLSDEERSWLTPGLLAQLAIGGYLSLTDHERQTLPASLLANLAIGSHISLTRLERDRLPENLLAQLVIGGKVEVEAGELDRFSDAVRKIVEQVSTTKSGTTGRDN
ncbi:MAG: hypothetical protein P8K08_14385 [Fuerstiella sp.]|jgi:hypothetical protein|nr:hypothetical protein [Fuerstiella sp.]